MMTVDRVALSIKSQNDYIVEGVKLLERKRARSNPGGSVIFYINDKGEVAKIEERNIHKNLK